jgi:hypothetical protein
LFHQATAGSFATCADPRFENEAQRELEFAVASVSEIARTLPISGLLLTGSLARGESIIRPGLTGDCPKWCSDLECLVVIPEAGRRQLGAISETLRKRTQTANDQPARKAKGLHIELSPILANRLRSLRPSIFAAELIEHGKLLRRFGDEEIPMPRRFDATPAILGRDALRLLNNRIMEQVADLVSKKVPSPHEGYLESKFWIELGTSLSVFLGCYRTTYKGRYLALESAFANDQCLAVPDGRLLMRKISEAMDAKFGPSDPSRRPPAPGPVSARRMALELWWWETGKILGYSREVGKWSDVALRLRHTDTSVSRIRDWGRFLFRSGMARALRTRAISAVLNAGSFGNAIYTVGCLLFFYWNEIGGNDRAGLEINRYLASSLAIDPATGPIARQRFAEWAVDAWQRHLRAAAL